MGLVAHHQGGGTLDWTTAQVVIQNVAHQALAKVGLYCPPQNGGTSCEYATTKKQDCINLNNWSHYLPNKPD